MSVVQKSASGRPSLVDGAEQAMRDWLAPGRFREGDRLPPEQELASMLGVSRGTLRSALSRLEHAGEIVRRQGSGTFVGRTPPPEHGFVRRHQRVDQWVLHAAAPGARVASATIRRQAPDARAARALSVDARAETQTISRLVSVDRTPAGAFVDVFSPDLAIPDGPTVREMLNDGVTIFDLLDRWDVPVVATHSTISACVIGPRDEVGRQLELAEPVACITCEELVFDVDDRAVVFSTRVFVPGLLWMEIAQSREAGPPAPLEH